MSLQDLIYNFGTQPPPLDPPPKGGDGEGGRAVEDEKENEKDKEKDKAN